MLKEVLANFKPTSSIQTSATNRDAGGLGVKLPKIEIPKFSGNYEEWVSFRDLFSSLIHNNNHIDNVQKLHYLKSSVSGEAEQLIRHIHVTADNYELCWTQLHSRYNNKKYLADCILKKLTSQKPMISETASGLKQLLDNTRECLHSVKNLGINTESWDIIVIFLIKQKLDPESRKKWEEKVAECNELPKMSLFEEFLTNQFRSIEFLDSKVPVPRQKCTHVATTTLVCSYCSGSHKLCNCKAFAKETTDARREFVQTHHLCFNCLVNDHSVYQCSSSTRCRLCKKKHHTLLHPKTPKSTNNSPTVDQAVKNAVAAVATSSLSQSSNETSDAPIITSCMSNTSGQILLATALVKVEAANNRTPVMLRSLLDQGSQASFVTESVVQMLGLRKTPETGIVRGLGGDRDSAIRSKSTVLLKFQSRLDPNFSLVVKAHVLTKLTCFLPSRTLSKVQNFPALATVELADPSFGIPNKIDLLLGAEVYSQILLEGLMRSQDPSGSVIAQNTRLGWILSGKVHAPNDSSCHSNGKRGIVSMHVYSSDENDLLKKFWEIESEPQSNRSKHLTPEEEKCEELFSSTTHRDECGRYVVRLPFKTDNPLCKYGHSRDIARKRFYMLERRFDKDPKLKEEYTKVIDEYLRLGHMEVVSNPAEANAVYLPHHAIVQQDRATSKTRVVFDASCKGSNGASLNSDLMTGPTIQPDLRHLIMNWRRYPIALIGDIVKMYRQVKVTEKDADFQRIYWRKNPEDELQHLRLLRVTFGVSSAPFLAIRTVQQLAKDEGADFPLAASRVHSEFYVDDWMSGFYSTTEAKQVCDQMTGLLARGGFPLHKLISNSKDLMHYIHGEAVVPEQVIDLKMDDVMKVVGLTWNRETDFFQCTINLPPSQAPVTKRRVLADIARLFDPLGWLAPAITTAKIFIQRLWLSGMEWDDVLPTTLLNDWMQFRNDLARLTEIRIPRWVRTSQDDQCVELHGFSDASTLAYAAVVYIRVIDQEGNVHVNLVTSKTRVAPIKQLSIPRLELCGAVLLAKLLNEVAETLNIEKRHLYAWTDSTIVLAWLSNHPSRWKTFVANRVSNILTILDSSQWAHVSSKDNPADCASRGEQPSESVNNELWIRGPPWLHLDHIDRSISNIRDTSLEQRMTNLCHVCHALTDPIEVRDPFLERFSTLNKLLRVLAWCRRFYRPSDGSQQSWLSARELQNVMMLCIKRCQNQYFCINDLTSEAFIAAFKRFVARRGHCAELWSNNATTFFGAARELKKRFNAEKSSFIKDLAEWFFSNGTTWHSVPPYSPNFGVL